MISLLFSLLLLSIFVWTIVGCILFAINLDYDDYYDYNRPQLIFRACLYGPCAVLYLLVFHGVIARMKRFVEKIHDALGQIED